MMATILSARYVAPGPWAGAIIAALGGLVRKECTMASATPASLESLRDRELALKLLEMEGQLWNEIQAFERRLTGEFGRTLTQVVERLSPGVEVVYGETLGFKEDDHDAV